MKKPNLLYLFILVFFVGKLQAQTCMHQNLSNKFNYKVEVKKFKDSDEVIDHAKIYLSIYDKKNKFLQKITLQAPFLYEDAYKHCNTVRSYITGYNKNQEEVDYDFGDLVIADLNFDGKEDFAIKYDSGGNGGPLYSFYLQGNNSIFKEDHFLTDSVGSFPLYMNVKHKTITTQIHANVHQEGKKTFKYNPQTKKWRLIKWVMVEG